jgi:NADH:ubiquinone oxidoreductase subunit E
MTAMANKKEQGNGRAGLLPALKEQAGSSGCLERGAMSAVCGRLGLPLNEAFGVATFYSFLPVSPVGKNVIRACRCLPCDLKDAGAVIAAIRQELGIGPGRPPPTANSASNWWAASGPATRRRPS